MEKIRPDAEYGGFGDCKRKIEISGIERYGAGMSVESFVHHGKPAVDAGI